MVCNPTRIPSPQPCPPGLLPRSQPAALRALRHATLRTHSGGFTDAAFVFDTKMEEWSYAAPLPAPRFVPSVLAFATQLYLL